MIRRYKRCVGLALFRWNRRQLEIWFCPAGTEIEPHTHPHIDSTIRLLWGGMRGTIGDHEGYVDMEDFFRPFHVPAGVRHSAHIGQGLTIFANWEVWRGDIPITSAAEDFTAV